MPVTQRQYSIFLVFVYLGAAIAVSYVSKVDVWSKACFWVLTLCIQATLLKFLSSSPIKMFGVLAHGVMILFMVCKSDFDFERIAFMLVLNVLTLCIVTMICMLRAMREAEVGVDKNVLLESGEVSS